MIIQWFLMILFALAQAFLEQFAVFYFRQQGASPARDRLFHVASGLLRLLVIAALVYRHDWWAPMALALALTAWVFFDGTLNMLTGQPWDYVGETALSDRLLRHLPHAEICKQAVCVVGTALIMALYMLVHPQNIWL